ncbi:hypothetical protein [Lactobacillus intestinalis]|uniref:hypothetical protein n=1 Tax=Lactobacillus intestinalis TaxID=151781 RepID=UPI0025A947B8|nr:hypothetical protein [Lactobacillus intestinalis]
MESKEDQIKKVMGQEDVNKMVVSAEIAGYTFNRSKKEVKLKVSAGSIGMDMNKLNELVESEWGVTLVIIQNNYETNTPEGQTELFDDEGNPNVEENDEEGRN